MSDPILPPPADKPPMPPQPKTVEVAKPDAAEIMLAEFRIGLKDMRGRFDELEEKVDSSIRAVKGTRSDVEAIQVDMRNMIEWRGGIEERLRNNSMRASTTNETDSRQDEALARIEKKLEGDDAFKKLLVDTTKEALGNPLVRKLGLTLVGAAIAAASSLTTYFQMRGH